jgi:hypothetical protein
MGPHVRNGKTRQDQASKSNGNTISELYDVGYHSLPFDTFCQRRRWYVREVKDAEVVKRPSHFSILLFRSLGLFSQPHDARTAETKE